jgi:hypothetical protein
MSRAISGMDMRTFRQNARRKMEFGVHEPAQDNDKGVSNLRHYAIHNPFYAKAMVRDVIECLRLMRTSHFREHLAKRNEISVPFYRKMRG